MSVKIGDNGGIKIGPETTYGTASAAYVAQHARSANPAPAMKLLDPATLGAANPAVRNFGVASVPGEIVLAYDDHRSVIGGLLAAAGNLLTNDYTIADGSAPDVWGQSIWVDYGGYAVQYLGAVLSTLRFEFQPDSPIVVTAGFLGQAFAPQTAVTITPPDETGILWESDISTVSIGGVAMCSLSGTIDITFPNIGPDRHCLGGGVIKQPVWAGRTSVTTTLNVELADDTGADSEAILASFYNNAALGDIIIGDFTAGAAYMTGDGPALGEGITQFPITTTCQDLVITTQA